MRGRRALGAEIVFGFDEAAPEVLLPERIDCDAGRERIGGINEPMGEVEAVEGGVVRWSDRALARLRFAPAR